MLEVMKAEFEKWHRFPVTDDMDIQTEVAWDNWQAAWEAATAAELGGRCCEHRFIGMDASFIHEPEIGAHPIVTVRFALNDWEGRDAFIKHFRHD